MLADEDAGALPRAALDHRLGVRVDRCELGGLRCTKAPLHWSEPLLRSILDDRLDGLTRRDVVAPTQIHVDEARDTKLLGEHLTGTGAREAASFVTCDDRILKLARQGKLGTRLAIGTPIEFVPTRKKTNGES